MSAYDVKQIMEILPHRYPMLLVDRILECNDKDLVVGVKNLAFNEPFFQGHFPGNPVMPGVMQLEAMAQVGGVLMNTLLKTEGQIAYFLAVDNAKFRRILVPGDQLRIEIRLLRLRMGMARVHGVVTCDGDIASEADLLFGAGGRV